MFLEKLIEIYDSDQRKITDFVFASRGKISWSDECVRHLTKMYTRIERLEDEAAHQSDYITFSSFFSRSRLSTEGLHCLSQIKAGKSISEFFRLLNYPPGSPIALEIALEQNSRISEAYACVLHACVADYINNVTSDPLREFRVEDAFNFEEHRFSASFVHAVEGYMRRANIDGKELTRQLGISLPTLKKYSLVSLNHLSPGIGRRPDGFKPDSIVEAYNRAAASKSAEKERSHLTNSASNGHALEDLAIKACSARKEIRHLKNQRQLIDDQLESLGEILMEIYEKMDFAVAGKASKLDAES